jgi:tripartite-type tricarboxylate transporter receptor subunit TctC
MSHQKQLSLMSPVDPEADLGAPVWLGQRRAKKGPPARSENIENGCSFANWSKKFYHQAHRGAHHEISPPKVSLSGNGRSRAAVLSPTARAQGYPSGPVRVIVGYPPGGAADIAARLIGQWLSEHLGKPFIVENRPGATTNIATETVVRAVPNGHTLLVVDAAPAINAALYPNLSFVFLRDLVPVACVTGTPVVMVVHPAVPAKTVPEFNDYAKSNVRRLNIASNGNGSVLHLAGELFKMMAEIELTHVP